MENRNTRNRKGQTGINYREFHSKTPTTRQRHLDDMGDKSNSFTGLLLLQIVAAATILTAFTAIRFISPTSYHTIDAGITASSVGSTDIRNATQQAISYIQTSETFSRLFATAPGKGNRARWTSDTIYDSSVTPALLDETCLCPVAYTSITSGFGKRIDPFSGEIAIHTGLDMAAEEGSQVVAAWCGTIRIASHDEIGGYYIIIDHASGLSTYYGHLSKILVSDGQTVDAGDIIAFSGNTGASTGPHLHFEITHNGIPVDPMQYLDV